VPAKFRIKVEGVDNWVKASKRFGPSIFAGDPADIEQAAGATFAHTQNDVHVITGSLKGSGRVEIRKMKTGTKVEILYGGYSPGPNNPVTYAGFEFGRGGSHDFMTPAVVATQHLYPEGMAKAMLSAFRHSFGV
jgi:hypothetical protein